MYADIYEYELPWLAEGQKASIALSYLPGKIFKGKVDYIYPYLESKSRTIKARLVFPNPHLALKPGMYTNVTIQASPVTDVLAVPLEAVLFSGERSLVFVSLGKGRFAPRDVVVGMESGDGYYEIKSGLQAGANIVLSGQFLLDSESRLQEGIAKLLGNRKKASAPSDTAQSNPNTDMDSMPGMDMGGSSTAGQKMDSSARQSMPVHAPAAGVPISTEKFGTVKNGQLTYYTCPMESHAFVKVNHPGDCPECGMKLVKKTVKYDEAITWYTCPMPEHAYVVEDHPGKCPVCGMELVAMNSRDGK